MDVNYVYPPSPKDRSDSYTSLPSSYKLKAALAILAIILFFVLYFGLVVALGYLVRWSIFYDMGDVNKITILGKLGAIAGSAMLFVFTLKFIFKLKNHRPENRIKLVKKEHPDLWKFVYEICAETGAPKPKSIFVDPDVNAYVSYTNSWLSLFFPVKKELTIGLGLVSCLNLSEFKAVVSHEFGHFAQSTMKVGSYIMSANTIIHDMIFNRDSWDEILDNWRASDFRISFAAWGITPIVWLIRQILNLFYQFLNVMYSSLSREMEFNADRVAASTSGSDAIIRALWKLDDGASQWNDSMNHLFQASKKKQYVDNVYLHHQNAVDAAWDQQSSKLASLSNHPAGGLQYFTGSELSKVSMYASHPPNDIREKNVKSPYLACEIDVRSPWLLFNEAQKIQKSTTSLIYNHYFNVKPAQYCSEVSYQSFIYNETKSKTLLAKYDNVFENRFAYIPDDIATDVKEKESEAILNDIRKIEKDLGKIIRPITEIEEKMQLAQQIAEGTSKLKSIEYEGKAYGKKELGDAYGKLSIDREKILEEGFNEWDIAFFSSHMELAQRCKKNFGLDKLILQHKSLSKLFRLMLDRKNNYMNALGVLQDKEQVTVDEVDYYTNQVKASCIKMNEGLDKLKDVDFVPLGNIDDLDELIRTIAPNAKIKPPYGNMFENGSFDMFVHEVDQSLQQLQRIEQKNMAEILSGFEEVKSTFII